MNSLRASQLPPASEAGAYEAAGDALARPHDNCYWLLPGQVLAGEYPGAADAARRDRRLAALLDAGVRCLIDLTELHEGLPPYAGALHRLAAERSLDVQIERYGIVDFSVPAPPTMRRIVDTVTAAVVAQRPVYLHCRGGIGRTGTAVGCVLVEAGFTPERALAIIERKWQVMAKRDLAPVSPENETQRDFIRSWVTHRRG